jgi:hypothetical protein
VPGLGADDAFGPAGRWPRTPRQTIRVWAARPFAAFGRVRAAIAGLRTAHSARCGAGGRWHTEVPESIAGASTRAAVEILRAYLPDHPAPPEQFTARLATVRGDAASTAAVVVRRARLASGQTSANRHPEASPALAPIGAAIGVVRAHRTRGKANGTRDAPARPRQLTGERATGARERTELAGIHAPGRPAVAGDDWVHQSVRRCVDRAHIAEGVEGRVDRHLDGAVDGHVHWRFDGYVDGVGVRVDFDGHISRCEDVDRFVSARSRRDDPSTSGEPAGAMCTRYYRPRVHAVRDPRITPGWPSSRRHSSKPPGYRYR